MAENKKDEKAAVAKAPKAPRDPRAQMSALKVNLDGARLKEKEARLTREKMETKLLRVARANTEVAAALGVSTEVV
jgi:hypothetical protein